MKRKFKRISKSTLSVILAIMMVLSTMLIGTLSVNAADRNANEFNQQYLYVDLSSTSKTLQGVNGYFDTTCTNDYGGWLTTFETLSNKVYKFDLSTMNSSYLYFRGFKVVFGDGSNFTIGVDTDSSHDCIKSNSSGNGGTWTTYSGGSGSDVTASDWKLNSNIYSSNWSQVSFTSASGKVVYLDVTPNSTGTYRFGITNGTYYKGGSMITSNNKSTTLSSSASDDAQINMSVAGTYKFAFDTSTGKLTVTYPDDEPQTYTVNYGSNSGTYGTVTASVAPGASVPSGTEVTFTATPNDGYKVGGWYSDSSCTQQISGTSTADTYTTKITANTRVYVKFVENAVITGASYDVILGGNTIAMVESPSGSGLYRSVSSLSDGDWFKVRKTDNSTGSPVYTYSKSTAGNSSAQDVKDSPVSITNWQGDSTSYNSAFKNAWGKTAYLVYDSVNNTFYFTEEASGFSTIYAKSCTYNINDSGVVGLNYGNTILLDADGNAITPTSTDDTHKYKTYSIESGVEVTISTTVDAAHYKAGKGYYVAGFVVNGETVSIVNSRPNSDGSCTYSGYYQVGEDSKIEITPVYFNQTIEDNGDYVYFTVEADDVPDNWGNTTAAYSYYYYYVNGTRYQYEQDGTWPGQPLLKTKTGVYWTMVSKYYYDEDSNKTDYAMSGIVFSNYGQDYVHKNQLGFDFYQTYDYNTPVVAIENGYDTISFATKYRNQTNNLATVGSSFNPDSYKNGWDIVWDYNHSKNVDIIGNEVVDLTSDPIYVVSTGPNKVDNVADYAAIWHVYAKTSTGYKKITEGLPSTFINPDSEQYKAMDTDEYRGRPTYISYEKENYARIDGRWHYSKQAELEIPVYLQAQYQNESGTWVYDNNGTAGTATIDGVAPDERGISSKTFHIGDKAQIVAAPKNGYVFEGWYLVDTQTSENADEYTFTKLDTIPDPSAEIIINRSMYLVARFTPIPEGQLALTHNALPGSGLGYYSIKAVVTGSDGSVKGTSENPSTVTLDIAADDTVEVTLSTRVAGINVFNGWYGEQNGEFYPVAEPGDKGVSFENRIYKYKFKFDAADLFDGDTLLINTMRFYSKITEVSSTATLNYQYEDRFGSLKTYTATAQLGAEYLEKHGYSMDNEDGSKIIMKYAPAVEDLYKNLKWEITNQSVDYSATTVTIKAINLEKTYSLSIKVGDAPAEIYDTGIKYNSLIDGADKTDDNPHGFKIKASDTDSDGKVFSYWVVTKTGDPENKEISRTYSKYFNLRIVDDYTITAVYGSDDDKNASISDPTYTREQYTVDGKDFDYLYADFVLSYTSKDGTIISEDPTRYNTGIILEFDKNIKIDAPAEGETVSLDGKTFETSVDKITYAIDNIDSGKFETYAPGTDSAKTRAIYNYKIDSSLYNNMNRVDYYLRFNNTANFQNYVMKAYFYVVDTATGDTTISEPVYFNLYEIGNSEPNKG